MFVSENEQQTVLHLSITQYAMKFLLRLVNTIPVLTVHHENQALSSGVVVPPKWSNFVLTADVPYVELHIFVCHGFNIETNCGRWIAEEIVLLSESVMMG